MEGASPQFVWRGRLHLGDEPGVYGDACYAGLSTDLPLTVREFEENPPDAATFVLLTEGGNVHPGYPGHKVEIVYYEETDQPAHYRERVLAEGRLLPGQMQVRTDLGLVTPPPRTPRYISVRVRLDTSMPPALYDDFVLVGLSLQSTKYYASFGFY
ncbi:MAG: hypothetical protein M3Q29_23290 [Chloroflexota bacterium]|nr:hypothetical protein [Chloroflexota bacterium]